MILIFTLTDTQRAALEHKLYKKPDIALEGHYWGGDLLGWVERHESKRREVNVSLDREGLYVRAYRRGFFKGKTYRGQTPFQKVKELLGIFWEDAHVTVRSPAIMQLPWYCASYAEYVPKRLNGILATDGVKAAVREATNLLYVPATPTAVLERDEAVNEWLLSKIQPQPR